MQSRSAKMLRHYTAPTLNTAYSIFRRHFAACAKQAPKRVIFFENHFDPITGKLLKKLVQPFKQMGFKRFYDEKAPDFLISDMVESVHTARQEYQHLKDQFSKNDLDINNIADIKKYVNYFYCQHIIHPAHLSATADSLMNKILELQLYVDVKVEYLEFLNELVRHKIQYHGIDLPNMQNNIEIAMQLLPLRDAQMIKRYLTTQVGVFGRNGLAHSDGMQSEILKHMPVAKAKKSFLFFYVYSIDENHPAVTGYDKYMRKAHGELPLGLCAINAINKTADAVAEEVLTIIDSHKQNNRDCKPQSTRHSA